MYVYCVVVSATCTSIMGWFLLHVRLLCGGFCYMYVYCGVVFATYTSIVGWFLLHVRLLCGGFCYMYVYFGVVLQHVRLLLGGFCYSYKKLTTTMNDLTVIILILNLKKYSTYLERK
jgi:hypothetical protein